MAAWPLAARAQQPDRMRRIGVLLPAASDDLEFKTRVGAFLERLRELGWTIGRNMRIDTRWATTNAADIRRHAAELAALAPDVILAFGSSTVGPMMQATHTVPIVFPGSVDPVRLGLVASLARPGGNLTGINFLNAELVAKRLELLRELLPGAVRIAVLVDPTNTLTTELTLRDVKAASLAMGLQIQVLNASTSRENDAVFETFVHASWSGSGLSVA